MTMKFLHILKIIIFRRGVASAELVDTLSSHRPWWLRLCGTIIIIIKSKTGGYMFDGDFIFMVVVFAGLVFVVDLGLLYLGRKVGIPLPIVVFAVSVLSIYLFTSLVTIISGAFGGEGASGTLLEISRQYVRKSYFLLYATCVASVLALVLYFVFTYFLGDRFHLWMTALLLMSCVIAVTSFMFYMEDSYFPQKWEAQLQSEIQKNDTVYQALVAEHLLSKEPFSEEDLSLSTLVFLDRLISNKASRFHFRDTDEYARFIAMVSAEWESLFAAGVLDPNLAFSERVIVGMNKHTPERNAIINDSYWAGGGEKPREGQSLSDWLVELDLPELVAILLKYNGEDVAKYVDPTT